MYISSKYSSPIKHFTIIKMSKRPSETNNTSKSKVSKHWSLQLVASMNDPDLIVDKSESLVVIKDKYPKAKIHYLVLPYENIPSIYHLNKTHVKLLETFDEVYRKLQSKHSDAELRGGFHAVPSMQRLHMHVISKDMVSPCLKTKQHWNSFTTRFFKPLEDVISELKENNVIEKISPEEHKSLLATTLQCNQCCFLPKTMPQLKEHLVDHK